MEQHLAVTPYADAVGLTREEIRAIGHVAIEAANFERLVERKILDTGGKPPFGFQPKLDEIQKIVRERLSQDSDTTALNAFLDLCAGWKSLVQQRNVYVHGSWILMARGDGRYVPAAIDKRGDRRQHFAAQAMDTARQLAQSYGILEAFFIRYGYALYRTSA